MSFIFMQFFSGIRKLKNRIIFFYFPLRSLTLSKCLLAMLLRVDEHRSDSFICRDDFLGFFLTKFKKTKNNNLTTLTTFFRSTKFNLSFSRFDF